MLYRLFKRFNHKSHNLADDSKSMRRISGKAVYHLIISSMAGYNTNLLVLAGCMFLLVISTQISFSLGLDNGRVSEGGFIAQVTEKFNREHLLNLRSKTLFDKFIVEHGKVYSTIEEYVRRLRIFEKNLLKAAENQALDPMAVHGITPFSDLMEYEFKSRYTGLLGIRQGLVNEADGRDSACR